MEFIVPQFIEQEPKIVGPFTFKQFVYIGAALLILTLLYFSVPKYLFIPLAIVLLGIALSCALLKIHGIPFPMVLKNFFTHLASPKLYIWTTTPFKKDKKEIKKKGEEIKMAKLTKISKKEIVLKTDNRGKLKNLFSKIEIKK